MGLNGALATAGRSLEISAAGIQVSGHNIANAGTPGYIREELLLDTSIPTSFGNLVFGNGADVAGLVQQIDKFLESRIHSANTDLNTVESRETIYKQLEAELRELGDGDLSTSLSNFLAAIHEVVNQPESVATRQFLIETGDQFAGDILNLRSRIDELRNAQNISIDGLTSEANSLIQKIAELNPQVVRLEATGLEQSEAGALRTQRYEALNRLSEIIPIRFQEESNGAINVYTSNDYLVLGSNTQNLETFTQVDRGVQVLQVRLSTTRSIISQNATGGELRGLIDGRDQILGGFVDELDRFAAAVIQEFNTIHASGEGLKGFDSVTAQNEVADTSAALNSAAAGLSFPPEHGSFQVKVVNKLTGLTQTATINVDLDGIGTDTSLDSLRAAIDAVANVSASITPGGRLQINADPNFEIRFANDSSGTLAGLGINTFFTGDDSATIGVNSAVAADHRLLATGQGGGPSDSRNALLLAEFSDQKLSSLDDLTLRDFYEATVAEVGQSSAAETTFADGLRDYQESLHNQREQISGVSIDEETLKIMEFQHSFQAAARLISIIDQLFTTLVSI